MAEDLKPGIRLGGLRRLVDHALVPAPEPGAAKPEAVRGGVHLSDLRLPASAGAKPGPKAPAAKVPAAKAPPPALKDGILFRGSRDYEEYLLAVLEEHGLYAELYEKLKVLYVSAADLAGLRRVWRRLGDLGLAGADALLEQAEVARQMGRMDLALEFLEKNARERPQDPHANYAMGMYYKLERDYELAVHWLRKWERLRPDDPEPQYHLGAVYRRIGSRDLALRHLRECLRLDPRHLEAKALLDKMG